MKGVTINSEENRRIQLVAKYIGQNLDKPMQLADLANIALYSPFHFQRIFKQIMGETPAQYIKRLRLEEAAHKIVLSPELSILEIAFKVGFNSLESFSRAFKSYYLISPDNFKKLEQPKKLQVIQHNGIEGEFLQYHNNLFSDNPSFVEYEGNEYDIVKLPAIKYIFLQTNLMPEQLIADHFKLLKSWASARDLATENGQLFGIIKDFPLFTPIAKCRYLTCLQVEQKPLFKESFFYDECPSRKYVRLKTDGDMTEIMEMLTHFAHQILPTSGYKVIHEPAIHFLNREPESVVLSQNSHSIYIPVEPK